MGANISRLGMEKEDGGLTKVIAKTQYIINNTMNYPESFKKGFIKEIEKELNQCEIIYNPNTKGIWFVNREQKYWYLEYKVESNYLWWRYDFFKFFTTLFNMESEVFNKVISEWVENKLNGKVALTRKTELMKHSMVDDTLNCKVDSTYRGGYFHASLVDDTLNCKVDSTSYNNTKFSGRVEETLNCKVKSTVLRTEPSIFRVEETLNCKVETTNSLAYSTPTLVEDILNCKVESTKGITGTIVALVEDTLKQYKVDGTMGKLFNDEKMMEDTLNIKVTKLRGTDYEDNEAVDETLDIKIKGTILAIPPKFEDVQETLNCQVLSTYRCDNDRNNMLKKPSIVR